MFVNYLPEPSLTRGGPRASKSSIGLGDLASFSPYGAAVNIAMKVAPKIIDKGMQLVSQTISSLAEKQTYSTTIKRNFDVLNDAEVTLPSKITLVRGDFATNTESKGEVFGDGKSKHLNQANLIGNKELHIEIEIMQSKDGNAIYFQPTKYFYNGQSSDGESTDELVLAFAFLTPGESLMDISTVSFQNFLHFEALETNTEYNFKSENGYDHSYQSVWMNVPLSQNVPYTLVVQIQEIREGNSFAQLLQSVYIENESYLKRTLNEKVQALNPKK
jgi:hypothetical protein